MNKIIKHIFLSLLFVTLIGSCNDEPEYYILETPPDQMQLKASAESVTLLEANKTQQAITFTWNKAADRGEGTEITYHFRMYHADTKNLQSELIKLDEETYSITFSVRELNSILHAWRMGPGEEVPIVAEVIAVVEGGSEYQKPEISNTTFTAIGYDPSNKLYLTVQSRGNKQYLPMNMVQEKVYNWEGELDVCDFWFVRNMQTGFPAYMKGNAENTLIYLESGEGTYFESTRLGWYNITINLEELTITIDMTPINRLFLIMSKNGVESMVTLKEIEPESDIYYLQDRFEEGTRFRFTRNELNLWPAYVKGADNRTLELKDEGAEMFTFTKSSQYMMTINMNNLSLFFIDVVYIPATGNLGIVGDAIVDAQWDAGAAIRNCPLTPKDLLNQPHIWSYTGQFQCIQGNDNQFKFVGDDAWGHTIFALSQNANPFDSDQQGATLENNGDAKWQLPHGTETGIYTVEVNFHTFRINLVRQ